MSLSAWQASALTLVALYASARVLELFASAVRSRMARVTRDARPVREPWWPAIVAVHVAVLGGTLAHVFAVPEPPPRPLLYAAGFALVAATLLRAWIFATLRHDWNVRVVTPARIATTGPYRWIRHPNYLAVIVEIAALPLLVGAWEVALLGSIANAVVLSWRIPLEERWLGEHHPTYRAVMMARPRFLPRLRRARPAPHPGRRDAGTSASAR